MFTPSFGMLGFIMFTDFSVEVLGYSVMSIQGFVKEKDENCAGFCLRSIVFFFLNGADFDVPS